eukprot:scaffold44885_cov26-Tisochrysis_lutea.AAC.1
MLLPGTKYTCAVKCPEEPTAPAQPSRVLALENIANLAPSIPFPAPQLYLSQTLTNCPQVRGKIHLVNSSQNNPYSLL